MQDVEVSGLDRVIAGFDDAPKVLRTVRAEVMESLGTKLLGRVRSRIGGSGKVQDWQDQHVGEGKGYVAVRAKANTESEGGYAVGYVTNAIENGHAIRRPAASAKRYVARAHVASVPGKHFYRDTRENDAEDLAEEGAKRIEDALVRKLNGG